MITLHPRLTAEGVVAVRRGERLRLTAERDEVGWVVGYGHRASARPGAAVSADDALALLVHDLSRSAAAVEALLRRPTPQPVFDALNAYARRVGPDAFARSDVLRRWNGEGEFAPAQATPDVAASSAPPGPASAVLAAAEAVRDRVSQVLDAPAEPPAPRPRREPWPEPPDAAPPLPPSARPQPVVAEPQEPDPPPFLDAPPAILSTPSAPPAPSNQTEPRPGEPLPLSEPADEAPAMEPSAGPIVSFERGGRARLWERLRENPHLHMAVGACGAALFLCALLGVATEKPTTLGVMLGLVGLLCLAPAVAFFLQRRARD